MRMLHRHEVWQHITHAERERAIIDFTKSTCVGSSGPASIYLWQMGILMCSSLHLT